MQQFNLDKWLQDKSRKVVTRDGRKVRIVCWDLKCNTPIIAAIQWNQEREDCYCYNTIGRCANNVGELDLFFADEEEELTDFESDLFTAFSDAWQQYLRGESLNIAEWAKEHSKELLESARKEFKTKFVLLAKEDYQTAFDLGKAEALKSLPKWKKCVGSTGPFIDDFKGEEYLYLHDYVIKISDLELLPKEE